MGSIIHHLGEQLNFKILRSLYLSDGTMHLRQLAARHNLSTGTVTDILRRFKRAGVVKETKVKNRKCYALQIPETERKVMGIFFKEYESNLIRERAPLYSVRSKERLEAMDELYSFYKKVKRKMHKV